MNGAACTVYMRLPWLDGQVHRDDAVVDLAQGPAVLPLDAGGFVAFLGDAGLVDQSDDARPVGLLSRRRQGVFDDAALNGGQQGVLVPDVMGEKLLKRAHGAPGGQGDGLDAFAIQVADQPAAVGVQMAKGVGGDETRSEMTQVFRERRPQGRYLVRSHP